MLQLYCIISKSWLVQSSDGTRTQCARYYGPPRKVGVSHVACNQPPVKGRYVRLMATGSNTRLVMCGMQVFAGKFHSVYCPIGVLCVGPYCYIGVLCILSSWRILH